MTRYGSPQPFEVSIRFVLWAQALGRVPEPEEIERHFEISYATSYRWRNAWCDANGLPIPAPRRERFTRERPKPAATGNAFHSPMRLQP